MTITTAASPGIIVNSAAMNESLPTQSEQVGNNTVVVSDDLVTLSNGNLETSPVYTSRLVIIRQGDGDEETRRIVGDTAGTGNLRILEVNEDWIDVPASSDTIHVSYIIQDAATLTGLGLVNKTVQDYSSSRRFQVGNGTDFAYMAFIDGVGLQLDDNGSTTVASFTINNNGRFDCGYLIAGTPTSGCNIQGANGSDGELMVEIQDGGEWNCSASYINCVNRELVDFNTSTTSKIRFVGVRWTFPINDILWGIQDTRMNNVAFISDDLVANARIDVRQWLATEEVKNIVVNGFDGFESNTSGDDPTLKNIQFISMSKLITIATTESWTIINPIWNPGFSDQNDISIAGSGDVLELFSHDFQTLELDGTALTAKVLVITDNLRGTAATSITDELDTDSNGLVSANIEARHFTDDSGTAITNDVTDGYAVIAADYGFLPIISAFTPSNEDETSENKIFGLRTNFAMSPDVFQVETNRGTAESTGGATQYLNQTNPATLFKFTGGSGTDPTVGDTIGNDSNSAEGQFRGLIEGDFVAGTMLLDVRDSTAWPLVAQVLDDAASGGNWTADFDDTTGIYEYSLLINSDGIDAQETYDLFNAELTKFAVDTVFNKVLFWANGGTNALPIVGVSLGSPNTFRTIREVTQTQGWMIYDSSGTDGVPSLVGWVDFEDDTGKVFIPSATVNLEVNVKRSDTKANIQSVQIIILQSSDGSTIASGTTNASGDFSATFTFTSDVAVEIRARKSTLPIPRFVPDEAFNTITATGLNQNFELDLDTIVEQV